MKHNGEEQGTLSLTLETLEKLGQAAMLKMFPTRCTKQSSYSVNT